MRTVYISVVFAFLCMGCVVSVPEQVVSTMSREPIEQESLGFVEVGSTKREEVLLNLGDPDFGHGNERVFVYQWTTMSAKEIKWAGYDETRYETRKKYQLIIGFDQDGIVNSYEFKKEDL